jgi:hypothetical protein
MKHITTLFSLLILLPVFWGCPVSQNKNNGPSDPAAQTFKRHRILTQAILFKVAAQIQEKYLEKDKKPWQDQQSQFYMFLNKAALSKNNINPKNKPAHTAETKYSQCANKIINSNQTCWTIKKIVEENEIPTHLNKQGEVLFNPYLFLPDPVDIEQLAPSLDYMSLWDIFYAAIILEEKEMLEKTYPYLVKRTIQEYPQDQPLYEDIYRMYKGEISRAYRAPPLSIYYLISGGIDKRLNLNPADLQKVQETARYYDENYYNDSYITVNQFTIENRQYMWLAARRQEQQGNVNKANVYIRTTFDNEVLRNIQKFPPNNQVYLYATIRMALKMNSPKMVRYVYGALDPLTKYKYTTHKELLKMQLLQLID